MKRITALILCFSLMASVFAGCAAEDRPYEPTGDALVYDEGDASATEAPEESDPQKLSLVYYPGRSMNPLTCTDYTNRTVLSLIYQGLFSVSRDYEAVPILCQRYEQSEDYRTYTFYIVPNATFSDGTAVTLSDVLATYEAAKESKYYSGRFGNIGSISIENGGIKFSLSTPMEDLPLLLDIPIVKASEVEKEFPLGSGPYAMTNSLTGAQLNRVLTWWCDSPDLDVTAESIPLVDAESPSQIRDQFEFSDVGLVCADPCADPYADFRCDYELWDCDNGIFLYLGSNYKYSEVFGEDGDAIRAALTYAINREALVEDNYRGFAQATTLPCDPSFPYYSPSLAAKYEYDPVQFISALSYVDLPDEPIQLLVNQDDSLRLRTARAIADMLTECGLNTVTMEADTKTYKQILMNGARSDGTVFDLYLGQTRLSANMDLSAFFRPWGNISYNGMSDEILYQHCKDALENSGTYYNLHQAVADDGRLCPVLFCGYAIYATRGLLTDLEPTRDNVFYYTLGRTGEDAMTPIDYDAEDDSVG